MKQNTRDLTEICSTSDELAESATRKLGDLTRKTVGITANLTDLSIHTKSSSLETPRRPARRERDLKRPTQRFPNIDPERDP